MIRLTGFTGRHRWIWAALCVLTLWLVLSLGSDRFTLASLAGIARSASFLTIVALGQMFVIATGRGNIDLSVASVVTLSAFITVTLSGGQDAGLPLALGAALAAGLAVGAVNAVLVVRLGIAAMIATLATGYLLATATLLVNRTVRGFGTPPSLGWLASGSIGGIPAILVLALLATAAAGLALRRLAFGRKLSATGQNARAADFAGIRTGAVTTTAFLISGLAAALAGALLSAYAGGAFLDMGAPYLLQSVGAVVLGGSLIFGGRSTALGTFLGSVLLILVVSTMQVWRLPQGMQDIIQGLLIIGMLALAVTRGRPA